MGIIVFIKGKVAYFLIKKQKTILGLDIWLSENLANPRSLAFSIEISASLVLE